MAVLCQYVTILDGAWWYFLSIGWPLKDSSIQLLIGKSGSLVTQLSWLMHNEFIKNFKSSNLRQFVFFIEIFYLSCWTSEHAMSVLFSIAFSCILFFMVNIFHNWIFNQLGIPWNMPWNITVMTMSNTAYFGIFL